MTLESIIKEIYKRQEVLLCKKEEIENKIIETQIEKPFTFLTPKEIDSNPLIRNRLYARLNPLYSKKRKIEQEQKILYNLLRTYKDSIE